MAKELNGSLDQNGLTMPEKPVTANGRISQHSARRARRSEEDNGDGLEFFAKFAIPANAGQHLSVGERVKCDRRGRTRLRSE